MKLVYRFKFRAWGITFGERYGEVDLSKQFPDYALYALAAHIKEEGEFISLVNERGVYIGINMFPDVPPAK